MKRTSKQIRADDLRIWELHLSGMTNREIQKEMGFKSYNTVHQSLIRSGYVSGSKVTHYTDRPKLTTPSDIEIRDKKVLELLKKGFTALDIQKYFNFKSLNTVIQSLDRLQVNYKSFDGWNLHNEPRRSALYHRPIRRFTSEKVDFIQLFTGSSGNCSMMNYEDITYIFDYGVSFKRIQQALSSTDFKVLDKVIVLQTHTDIDHAIPATLRKLMNEYDVINVYVNEWLNDPPTNIKVHSLKHGNKKSCLFVIDDVIFYTDVNDIETNKHFSVNSYENIHLMVCEANYTVQNLINYLNNTNNVSYNFLASKGRHTSFETTKSAIKKVKPDNILFQHFPNDYSFIEFLFNYEAQYNETKVKEIPRAKF